MPLQPEAPMSDSRTLRFQLTVNDGNVGSTLNDIDIYICVRPDDAGPGGVCRLP